MPYQFGEFRRRLFQSFFYSMDLYLTEAKVLFERIHAQDMADVEALDQVLWMREKAISRAAFIMGIAGLEAFANQVLADFAVRSKSDTPSVLLTNRHKPNRVTDWPLAEKVYFLPSLCNRDFSPPAVYFNRQSPAFALFEELVSIRHSIMHAQGGCHRILFELRPDKRHIAHDAIEENFWPKSQIPKDVTAFNYECAESACGNLRWVRDSIVDVVSGIDDRYMRKEDVHLTSDVIPDSAGTIETLLKNWKRYTRNRR